jgi:hypothetical protein
MTPVRVLPEAVGMVIGSGLFCGMVWTKPATLASDASVVEPTLTTSPPPVRLSA